MSDRPENISEKEWACPTLNGNYWDCDCKGSPAEYIKPVSEGECPDCGALQEDAPESHAREVRLAMIGQRTQLPVNVHIDSSDAWIECTDRACIVPAPTPEDIPDAEDWHWYWVRNVRQGGKLNEMWQVVSMVSFDVEDFMGGEEAVCECCGRDDRLFDPSELETPEAWACERCGVDTDLTPSNSALAVEGRKEWRSEGEEAVMSRADFWKWMDTCPSKEWFVAEDEGDGLRIFFCVDEEEEE